MKFGGTSVGNAERLLQVMRLIEKENEAGSLAVVVSAMGHTTDHLIDAVTMAATGDMGRAETIVDRIEESTITHGNNVLEALHKDHTGLAFRPDLIDPIRQVLAPLRQLLRGVSIVREKTPQTLDLVMSFGERISASLLTLLLQARRVDAVFVDARDWVLTDDSFGLAKVDVEKSRTRLRALAAAWTGKLSVHTGFLGRTADGRTTTLGRNGSDYTAALLAQALEAREVVIWTDVSGVMTADPAIVDDVYTVPRLSHQEALELANLGWRMFHPRTMIPLIESNIPMHIRNTADPEASGTYVDAAGSPDADRPTCVTSLEDLALIEVEYKQVAEETTVGERVLRALDDGGVVVWMAVQTPRGRAIAVVVPHEQSRRAETIIRDELARELDRKLVGALRISAPVTLVTLVAEAMGRTVNVTGRFLHAVGRVGVMVRACAQGVGERSISAVIDAADTHVALRTVHAAFNLAHQPVSIFLLGKGTVGSHFLQQIRAQKKSLLADHNIVPRVVGLADSRRVLFDAKGIDLERWNDLLAQAPQAGDAPPKIQPLLDELRRLPVPVLVDCTAEKGMEELYLEAFARGIHVVASNKKPLTLPWPERQTLMGAALRHHRSYLYETTVGASLPVINTLKNLVNTGDHVLLIEGAFSGTLGYLCNELMSGVPLSQAVRTAKELGYTEPHPRDDLSGMDVARKALILARELGYKVELEDIEIEPFVPVDLLKKDDLEEFFRSLTESDPLMRKRIEQLQSENKLLRYLATIDPEASKAGSKLVSVKPVGIGMDHPASRLRGSEAFVSFTTERYQKYPLIVQGAGAGGAVTAAGVLADVLELAQMLRGK
ncbi:MAG: bifunctional aspartate kinase/homoserine dehydrogenase I [Myxococcales bacterium]|nr:bifunctional aspartate kinase/homoserine dehydrogenase I [Myxococcales bacterium]